MIKYGQTEIQDLKFHSFRSNVESRDDLLMDIWIRFELDASTPLPEDLTELTAWVIATHQGRIVEIVPQDEGTDCEYRFTQEEKQQITRYVEEEVLGKE